MNYHLTSLPLFEGSPAQTDQLTSHQGLRLKFSYRRQQLLISVLTF